MTAAELLKELENDDEYVKRRALLDAADRAHAANLAQAERPLIEALEAAGIRVRTVWELDPTKVDPTKAKRAAEILLDHLGRPYPAVIRDGIARALADCGSSVPWRTMKRLYEAERDEWVRQGLATAVAATARPSDVDELLAMVRDRRNGASRALMIETLGVMRGADLATDLSDVGDDPEIAHELARVLAAVRERRQPLRPIDTRQTVRDVESHRTSISLDRENVPQLFEALVHGGVWFRPTDAQAVLTAVERLIEQLADSEEGEVRIELENGQGRRRLVVRVFMDDPESPDIYFLGPRDVIRQIDTVLRVFNESGSREPRLDDVH
ncbi:MAG TPA: hypothetical protein VHF69_06235 [Candidatus Synoicihabitans sp.]|nr:hypothetical protein [Candidatus Synoicihabitans sp.]